MSEADKTAGQRVCRCLLRETDEKELLENIREYISGLEDGVRADEETYKKRLAICEKCESLRNGVCMKCGCYVEMRAAVSSKGCPSEKNYW